MKCPEAASLVQKTHIVPPNTDRAPLGGSNLLCFCLCPQCWCYQKDKTTTCLPCSGILNTWSAGNKLVEVQVTRKTVIYLKNLRTSVLQLRTFPPWRGFSHLSPSLYSNRRPQPCPPVWFLDLLVSCTQWHMNTCYAVLQMWKYSPARSVKIILSFISTQGIRFLPKSSTVFPAWFFSL